jgi:hypothetical protein
MYVMLEVMYVSKRHPNPTPTEATCPNAFGGFVAKATAQCPKVFFH